MKGILRASRHVGRHVITSALEHASVSGCLTAMQEQLREFEAVTDEERPIPTGADVLVTGVTGGDTLVVESVAGEP